MATIYYECGIPGRLIPVQFLGYAEAPMHHITGLYNVVIKLKRAVPGSYSPGDVLHVPTRAVVRKAGVQYGIQRVAPAMLPPRTEENTTKARV